LKRKIERLNRKSKRIEINGITKDRKKRKPERMREYANQEELNFTMNNSTHFSKLRGATGCSTNISKLKHALNGFDAYDTGLSRT